MTNPISIRAFDVGNELQELYWFAGTAFNERSDCLIRPVLRGVDSGTFHMCSLPMGMLPVLTLGRFFDHGQILDMTMRGTIESVLIEDMSQYSEITSADLPNSLYSFGNQSTGRQKLLRYEANGLEVFVPTMELIRYLYLHNKTLANALMRPDGLMTLFNPQFPGFHKELRIDFTAEMPKSSLTNDFAQEFAWIAMDVNARKSWDSVRKMSLGQTYLTFVPPGMKNSTWQYRGIKHENQLLILEIMKLSGRSQPCDKLVFGHPSMKQITKVDIDRTLSISPDNEVNKKLADSTTRYEYTFELEDDGGGTTQQQKQKVLSVALKICNFERRIPIERLLTPKRLQSYEQRDSRVSNGRVLNDKTISKALKKTCKVSAADVALGAALNPIEFALLLPGSPEDVGDLEVMEDVVKQMSLILPNWQFSMAICKLKPGKVFSTTNRHARLALIVTIYSNDAPPIYILDVDHTGDIALSLLAVSFKVKQTFDELEPHIKAILDGLVGNNGHWDTNVEERLALVCSFERFPKMVSPRVAGDHGRAAILAYRLAHRLGLARTE